MNLRFLYYSFSLVENIIGDVGAEALGEGLKENKSLVALECVKRSH